MASYTALAAAVPPTLTTSVSFPATVTVGDAGLGAKLTFGTAALGGAETITMSSIKLYPSCGTTPPTATCATPDQGVFQMSATGTGEANTQCAGVTFTISAPAVDGAVTFTTGSPVVLAHQANTAPSCVIDFSFSVLKQPTHDSMPDAGDQTTQLAQVSGLYKSNVNDTGTTLNATGTDTTTVDAAVSPTPSPTPSTSPSQSASATPSSSASPTAGAGAAGTSPTLPGAGAGFQREPAVVGFIVLAVVLGGIASLVRRRERRAAGL